MQAGVNLFGLNQQLKKDFDGTMYKLKEMGYTVVEPVVVFENKNESTSDGEEELIKKWKLDGSTWMDKTAAKKIERIREIGLEVPGIHAGTFPVALAPIIQQVKQFAVENNLKYCVFSPQTKNLEEAEKYVKELKTAVKEFKSAGIELLIHNHAVEMVRENGRNTFEYMMEKVPDVRLELDLGWVKAAGEDVIETMHSYRERIAILHYKDLIESRDEENNGYCFTALGEGILPLREILKESKKLHLMETGHIIDQDTSLGDMMQDLEKGVSRLQVGE